MNIGRASNATIWTNIKLKQYLYLKIHEEGKNGQDYIPKSVVPTLVRKQRKFATVSKNVKIFFF